ncbi:unnamed protein product [Owenia fusiformis]|uniref:Uncharacterized protein n=1 Tax=Owenia fusiformis TaxID=6347 RepID=A0A8J1XXS4_OWEFU|nr:unnamed protein product [Owenia fusiformis]
MGSTKVLKTILDETSTLKYFIEYDGFFSNHMSHGLIALSKLGASETRLRRFIKVYEAKLESTTGPTNILADDSFEELKGERKSYYSILKHFEDLAKGRTITELLNSEFPKVAKGMVCSAIHGLIHTGYAVAVQNTKLTCEGLAYLHHSFVPLIAADSRIRTLRRDAPTYDILEAIGIVAKDDTLFELMKTEVAKPKYTDKVTSNFQRRVAALFTVAADTLLDYIDKITLPPTFNPNIQTTQEAVGLGRWLLDCAITVYVKSENKNDFFLLHGVTGAWSLLQILPALTYNDAIYSIRVFMCAFVATYLAQMRAPLTVDVNTTLKPTADDWDKLIEATVDEERDEHIYKLVQVCHGLALEDDVKHTQQSMYFQAANIAISNALLFVKYD